MCLPFVLIQFVHQGHGCLDAIEFAGDLCRREMRRLRNDEDTTVRLRQSPRSRPTAPGIVQEHEVGAVVGHKDPTSLNRCKYMDIVSSVFEAELPRGYYVMAASPQQVSDLTEDIVIELEAGHRRG